MSFDIVEFERPIVEIEQKIEALRHLGSDVKIDVLQEIKKLDKERLKLLESTFGRLTRAQVVQLARHARRPHALDYIEKLFTEFEELHGDRHFADDAAIVGGVARFDDCPVMLIGHERGRSTKEKVQRNFAMPRPEGYRKALRLMKLAEKFSLPIITFIDTPGAYPGIDAEERNQSEAIARNLFEMSTLQTPIIAIVIGEGGSGGALAIGVADRVLMLQYSIYSVISPEGCASILWRSAEKAAEAAEAMKVTAADALDHQLIDDIIPEPLGSAYRDEPRMCENIRLSLRKHLSDVRSMPLDTLLQKREEKLLGFGVAV